MNICISTMCIYVQQREVPSVEIERCCDARTSHVCIHTLINTHISTGT